MEWCDEKETLLATICRQEQEAAALAKRFKLLQQTLKEQQKLLDRYQRVLDAAKAPPRNTPQAAPPIDNTRGNTKTNTNDTYSGKREESKHPAAPTWMKKKTDESSDLKTIPVAEAPVSASMTMEAQETMKTVFKPTVKRKRGELAATWAEEKQKLPKKSKWELTLEQTASGANKENMRAELATDKPNGFAYVEVVRNREERKALPGRDCIECKKYYDALGEIGAGSATAQKNKCSRHRARFEPYQTPDDFWRLSFPDSEPEARSPSVN